jgi:hypothetical protein
MSAASDTARLRSIQDRFLALPSVAASVLAHGAYSRIDGPGTPTYYDVKYLILPEWEEWLTEFIEKHETSL